MSNRIEIRGVIVPSDMDQDFMFSYIQRGIITPESIVRKAIANANSEEDIDLYINSQGGSVFAGNEMINALQDWKNETGNKINVIVGAMAASMGSSILISVADSISVHANSKIMFHGAWGGAMGGASAMKDYSELLEKINSDIKVKLLSKYNLDADTVNEWFAEGREGWLTAEEAKTIGMADIIIGESDELPESANNIESMLNEKGMKIAAVTLSKFQQEKVTMEKIIEMLKAVFGIDKEASEDEVLDLVEQTIKLQNEPKEETEDVCDDTEAEPVASDDEADADADGETEEEEAEEDEESAEDASDDEPADVIEEEVQDLHEVAIEMHEKVDSLNDALNKKQSENDKLKADMDKLTTKLEQLLGKGLNFEEEKPAPADWKSCLDECGGDYVQARKQFPDVYAKMMK